MPPNSLYLEISYAPHKPLYDGPPQIYQLTECHKPLYGDAMNDNIEDAALIGLLLLFLLYTHLRFKN